MGHIELAAPAVHIWYLRGTRSWLAYLLIGHRGPRGAEGQAAREGHLLRRQPGRPGSTTRSATTTSPASRPSCVGEREAIEKERELELAAPHRGARGRARRASRPRAPRTTDLTKPASKAADKDLAAIRERYEAELDLLNRAWDEFKDLFARQIIEDEMLWRELEDRYGEYFEGGMGADAIKQLIDRIDLDDEEVKLRAADRPARRASKPLSAQRKQKAIKRLKIVSAFNRRDENGNRINDPRAMILDVGAGDPAGAAPDGPARRWPLRHLRPERPLPPGDQPEQPPQAPARPRVRPRSSSTTRSACCRRPSTRCSTTAAAAARSRARATARSSRSPTCSRASRAGSARTCSASASTTPAVRSSWSARRSSCTSAACPS